MAARRFHVRDPRLTMTVTGASLNDRQLVYVISADNRLSYPRGRSRIAYIGATKTGSDRVLQSAAVRADSILDLHGVRSFDVHVISSRPRENVRIWIKLERALLLEFRSLYGEVPVCNVQGGRMRELDEFDCFSRNRIRSILLGLEK